MNRLKIYRAMGGLDERSFGLEIGDSTVRAPSTTVFSIFDFDECPTARRLV
ncbi:MAG: hypothetical protein OXG15_01190 [Gammaproteobacteria bacterium]|nr:hypothetical protein [Gammaproteobacteria bacterium]